MSLVHVYVTSSYLITSKGNSSTTHNLRLQLSMFCVISTSLLLKDISNILIYYTKSIFERIPSSGTHFITLTQTHPLAVQTRNNWEMHCLVYLLLKACTPPCLEACTPPCRERGRADSRERGQLSTWKAKHTEGCWLSVRLFSVTPPHFLVMEVQG